MSSPDSPLTTATISSYAVHNLQRLYHITLLLLLLLKSRDYNDTITQKNVAGALYSQYRNVTQTRRVRRQFKNVHTVVSVQRAEVNQSSSGKEPSSASYINISYNHIIS